jgi:hypothetical protein
MRREAEDAIEEEQQRQGIRQAREKVEPTHTVGLPKLEEAKPKAKVIIRPTETVEGLLIVAGMKADYQQEAQLRVRKIVDCPIVLGKELDRRSTAALKGVGPLLKAGVKEVDNPSKAGVKEAEGLDIAGVKEPKGLVTAGMKEVDGPDEAMTRRRQNMMRKILLSLGTRRRVHVVPLTRRRTPDPGTCKRTRLFQ